MYGPKFESEKHFHSNVSQIVYYAYWVLLFLRGHGCCRFSAMIPKSHEPNLFILVLVDELAETSYFNLCPPPLILVHENLWILGSSLFKHCSNRSNTSQLIVVIHLVTTLFSQKNILFARPYQQVHKGPRENFLHLLAV